MVDSEDWYSFIYLLDHGWLSTGSFKGSIWSLGNLDFEESTVSL